MLESYRTIQGPGEALVVEKKSKFIATVCEVKTQEEAEACLQQLRKKYYDARHNCFAYQIGEKNEIQRCSDDGEPQGTAGKPILEVLKGEDVRNTLICVTRYFGGTLLGTGGLVRAYGKAAKEGLLNAGIIEKRRIQLIDVQMNYTLVGKVQYLLGDKGYRIRDSIYTDVVTMQVEVLLGEQDAFCDWLTENTNAEVSMSRGEFEVVDVLV
ncbi:YigZ family protein [Cellulosilyticum ruminicola]|uniref:YigZ family protein n=1 Tax=Cellulosilyticum ruminicola TaxID=425254 RepID=UPI0006D2626E|nr:YigZ family protein [Cellulosilyticum ruminicola]